MSRVTEFKTLLHKQGVLLLNLDKPPSTHELIEFAQEWGSPIEELNPRVKDHVSQRYVLNIRNSLSSTKDFNLQPFSGDFITLHTESSASPDSLKPNYLMLYCKDSCSNNSAYTLLRPVLDVLKNLSEATRGILSQLQYDYPGTSCILEGTHLAFRDFYLQSMPWRYLGKDIRNPEIINQAIEELVFNMYRQDPFYLKWQKNLLLVIDNRRWMHGRTVLARSDKTNTRHLMRIKMR
ncbi:Taurine catabolism dioxygenase TauD, TfdA family [Pseudobacteriovorax antillogorgiicola]|uniref:Taurine catabolism dioxygenase TauD, TfdA family n=2 Tax=Pseudobacteriovorax antillogorgiicola TaxID=1513793 RepID=A0A1Y6B9F6_9BACT|nr:TfdA family taurine catabolism dioxygenase TauD [Pseudobacteriovorax antillogorgiicola]SME99832.1 Taurine catabolism dioxygenase TauD, TfdA family [Pseudobacteriovorax antillogorgiicola]